MSTVSFTKVFLHVLNSIFTILGVGIAATSIWFFVQVYEFTSLRNSNHYMLDYKVYWPQIVPWMFFFAGFLVMCVSCCGFISAKKNSRGLVVMYVAFVVLIIVGLIIFASIALVFADSKLTDDFVKDTIWDVYFQSKNNHEVAEAYGNIEKKLHCCGADSPRDYKNWKDEFPMSCCDTYYHGFLDNFPIDCQFTNKLANERHGCTAVASQYARIVIKVLSGVSLFTALVGITSIVVALTLSGALKKQKQRSLAAQHESESKKVLL